MFESIPNELRTLKQWVCWRGDKLPKNPYTGRNAQSNNPETWGTFDDAINAVDAYHMDGVGFMFAPPYFGVDLDHCMENSDIADEFVETLQSYNEYSRSGDGLHIICKGSLPAGGRRKGGVEMYQDGRYFIMTGRPYNNKYSEIVNCTESIKALHEKYIPAKTSIVPSVRAPEIALSLEDSEVIEKARACKTGAAFQYLYAGDWQALGAYNSQSEADIALCNILAFWTGRNEAQMDRLFRASGLMRPKWDRAQNGSTYGAITIAKAVASCAQIYEPKRQNVADLALNIFDAEDGLISAVPNANYDMTDTGNAHRFADKYSAQVRYSFNRKKWMYWDGRQWVWDDVGEVKNLADTIIDDLKNEAGNCSNADMQKRKFAFAEKTASSHNKTAMLTEAQHLGDIPVRMDDLDCFDMYFNARNGIVSLRNGELLPHDPSLMLTKLAGSEYTQGDRPKLWLKFLDDVTAGDKELQKYLQKCVGYSLTGSTSEQCLFFLYGMGNNGKSTFLDTISAVMGTYAMNVQPDTIMVRRNDGVNSDIARLKSARMVTCEEATEGVRLNEGLVKQLTGGGAITCRFLYGDEFEYVPEFKIWLATNHRPVIRGTDLGIWRRIRMIPFTVCIPADKVDKQLKYKLIDEYPAILSWAVEGCRLWQEEGLNSPKCVADALNEYKSEMDLLQSFADACLMITNNPLDTISAAQLYGLYKSWAKDMGEYEMSGRKFGAEIVKKVPEKKRLSDGIYYTGVRLLPQNNLLGVFGD